MSLNRSPRPQRGCGDVGSGPLPVCRQSRAAHGQGASLLCVQSGFGP